MTNFKINEDNKTEIWFIWQDCKDQQLAGKLYYRDVLKTYVKDISDVLFKSNNSFFDNVKKMKYYLPLVYDIIIPVTSSMYEYVLFLSGNTTRTIVYGVIYLVIRIIYAFMYILGLQPWRTIVFALGMTCTLACNLDLVISMSRRSN